MRTMPRVFISIIFLLLLASLAQAQKKREKLTLDYSNGPFEVVLEDSVYVIYIDGPARFSTETGFIYCDSAIWKKGDWVRLNGRVKIDDAEYKLTSDSVYYDIVHETALAQGSHVELWSYTDSIYATGKYAFFDQKRDSFRMQQRPTLLINYPDTARMIEIISDYLEYDKINERAEATGRVTIVSQDVSTSSGCAVLGLKDNTLDLFESPKASRNNSEIQGSLISLYFDEKVLSRIDVIDSAQGVFVEPHSDDSTEFDRSELRGNRLILDFAFGKLAGVLCYGQSYSWYNPASMGSNEVHENAVSGDTIRFTIQDEQLKKVNVIGGAVGSYIKRELDPLDSNIVKTADTVDYDAQYIEYGLEDSLITLTDAARVNSGTVELRAQKVLFDTNERLIEAFSAAVDSSREESEPVDSYKKKFQPNTIPVVLKDGNDDLLGDYLIYSIDTKKGRIVKSKTDFEAGYYYGNRMYREQEKTFYVDDGRYTSCDAEEPHFHFHSSHMKLIEGEKLLAKPVVFYIERIPILALPFYIFPLDRGRHSGILPFTFGKFERGERYVRNVGYYWAASEFWDWQGSFDYHEESQNITFNSKVNYNIRYKLNGYFSGSFLKDTDYDPFTASESKRNRWDFNTAYNHNISPSFNIRATGKFVSDNTYYADYSSNQDDLLDKSIKSSATFSKRFGRNTSLSGGFSHTVNLDDETRFDEIPNMTLSLPTIYPFGNGSRDEDGQLRQHWYNNLSLRYTPSLRNVSNRITLDSTIIDATDTLLIPYRSRREYAKITHNPSINLPAIKLGYLANIVPRVSYSETWYKIFETDQSIAAGIDASETYRTYSYSAGAEMNTTLYGTIYPNIFGLKGLRHVLNPTVSYSYSPELNRHPGIRSYTGGGAGSNKSSIITVKINNNFQAKVRNGETEKSVNLLTISPSFSYNYEAKTRPYSDLYTSFNSQALGRIQLNGSLTHSFYKPKTDELEFFSPYLKSFDIQATFRLAGKRFLFDDVPAAPSLIRGADSLSNLSKPSPIPGQTIGRKGWTLSTSYRFREQRIDGEFSSKIHTISMNMSFNLTPTTSVTYSQYYDIKSGLTVYNSVNIVKTIHCWTGSLHWVPIGSNRGFGFQLNVTAIPEIKLDNNFDSFKTSRY